MSATLQIKLVKSQIGVSKKLRKVLTGLGLRKTNETVLRKDTPEIRGMIFKVRHLVQISDAEGESNDNL
ncbi:50S ribosomal protein L30 [candidate division KSB3 bacterium]|jgi:large subunit ribosomal protein L30|uniref:50S ribosomal protein L30 n=1 Tax=candidate division KSB3 bacterium TaxID=2044937 RepID=A0A9D5Q5X5_9BACT|nr:50S ribosomal protein L30 [candidate division KSB3 bacterium]